jgi:lipoprotein-releasing system permease protein
MTMASLVGIALGVAALIIILSVMNGFALELRTRLLSMSAQATVSIPKQGLTEWRDLQASIADMRGVTGAAPYVSLEGMLEAGSSLSPALIRGIVPAQERGVSDLGRLLRPGVLERLEPGSNAIILGQILALNLGVEVGDRVNLLVPRIENHRPVPKFAAFTVAGIFEAGIAEHDANLAFIDMRDASALKGLRGRAEGLAVRLTDPMSAPAFQQAVSARLGDSLHYSNWTVDYSKLFGAIRVEKTMMTVILMFIVGVAAFNIVASLMMLVTDKERDIAILRTCGLEPGRIARVFFVQGAVIGVVGTLVGAGLGLACAFNVATIVPWLESTFHFQIMPGDVYYVTEIPSQIEWRDVTLIPALALLVALLATVYPSRRAARIAPAEALRYE